MASFYSSLWQFGQGEYGSLKEIAPNQGNWHWKPKLNDFMDSLTVADSVSSLLDEIVTDLPKMEVLNEDSRWCREVRKQAKALRQDHAGEEAWFWTSEDYRDVLVNPSIYLGYNPVTTTDFLVRGEKITESDAYGALGPFGLRAYLSADISKKAGDERIYVSPKRVAVRIYDEYGFTDSGKDQVLGFLLSARASQFLGNWTDAENGEEISLANEDFTRYRNDFRPIYNSFLDSKSDNRPHLVCRDFETFSEYIERDVTGAQYVLAGA
jgi:hypothetical protein